MACDISVKEGDKIIGIYYFNEYLGRWYVKEAIGKHPFRAISYKTSKGAEGYIRRQAKKYTSAQEGIQRAFGIKAI